MSTRGGLRLSGEILLVLTAGCTQAQQKIPPAARVESFTCDHGGITRGDRSRKELAIVFTADAYAEGTEHVLDVLARRGVKASFFLTGNYLRNERFRGFVPRMVREGHYVGPHSDAHLLYSPWEDREQSLVSREAFVRDLSRNIRDLRRLGALREVMKDGQDAHATVEHGQDACATVYFIPPYEWYNRDHVAWAHELGAQIINFTPGIGSNRDYMSESDPKFRPSRRILSDIMDFEQRDPNGLNGAILLLHLGADRRDKMYLLLDDLLDELHRRGYILRRVDALLRAGCDRTRMSESG